MKRSEHVCLDLYIDLCHLGEGQYFNQMGITSSMSNPHFLIEKGFTLLNPLHFFSLMKRNEAKTT